MVSAYSAGAPVLAGLEQVIEARAERATSNKMAGASFFHRWTSGLGKLAPAPTGLSHWPCSRIVPHDRYAIDLRLRPNRAPRAAAFRLRRNGTNESRISKAHARIPSQTTIVGEYPIRRVSLSWSTRARLIIPTARSSHRKISPPQAGRAEPRPQTSTCAPSLFCGTGLPVCDATLRAPLGLQLNQQLLDAVFLLKRGQAVFDVVDRDLGFRLADRFLAHDFVLHAIKGRGFRSVADVDFRVAGLAYGAGAAVLRDQEMSLGLGFG